MSFVHNEWSRLTALCYVHDTYAHSLLFNNKPRISKKLQAMPFNAAYSTGGLGGVRPEVPDRPVRTVLLESSVSITFPYPGGSL